MADLIIQVYKRYFDNDDFIELSGRPNPLTDYLTWHLYGDRDQFMDIALFDATGRVVLHDQRLAESRYSVYTMDVSDFTSGIYFIRLSTAQKVYFTTISKKIVNRNHQIVSELYIDIFVNR